MSNDDLLLPDPDNNMGGSVGFMNQLSAANKEAKSAPRKVYRQNNTQICTRDTGHIVGQQLRHNCLTPDQKKSIAAMLLKGIPDNGERAF